MPLHDAENLVHVSITFSLDYNNTLLTGCSSRCINKLYTVQYAAAKELTITIYKI